MVLAFRPDSRATFRKEMPRSAEGVAAALGCGGANHFFDRARANIFSSGRPIAERLSDCRNVRRVEDKSSGTFPVEPVLESGAFLYSKANKAMQARDRTGASRMQIMRRSSVRFQETF